MAINIKKKPDLSSLVYGCVPPQAIELENIIIGTLLNEKDRLETVLDILPTEDYFYQDTARKMYAAILRLHYSGYHVDIKTVMNELSKTQELELVGGAYALMKLSNDVVSGAHIESHAKIVAEKFISRETIRICGETIAEAYEDSGDILGLVESTSLQISKVTAFANGDTTEHIRGPLVKAMKEMDEMSNRTLVLTGTDTGFRELNDLTNGWQDEDLIIIAARPSQGKTAIALHFTIAALISELSNKNGGVFIASLEMNKKQLTQRILAYVSGVNLSIIKDGSANLEQRALIIEASAKIADMEIHIEDQATLTVNQICNRARKVQKKLEKQGKKLLMCVTDYLQLTSVIDDRRKNTEEKISESSRDAKKMAKVLGCPHIMLSQMSRDIEKGQHKRRPNLGDLRGSGAIEQDADVVVFIHHETDPNTHIVSNLLLVEKHRNGATGNIEVKFYGANQKWTNKEDTTFKALKKFEPPIQINFEDEESTKKINEGAPF